MNTHKGRIYERQPNTAIGWGLHKGLVYISVWERVPVVHLAEALASAVGEAEVEAVIVKLAEALAEAVGMGDVEAVIVKVGAAHGSGVGESEVVALVAHLVEALASGVGTATVTAYFDAARLCVVLSITGRDTDLSIATRNIDLYIDKWLDKC